MHEGGSDQGKREFNECGGNVVPCRRRSNGRAVGHHHRGASAERPLVRELSPLSRSAKACRSLQQRSDWLGSTTYRVRLLALSPPANISPGTTSAVAEELQ